MGKLRLTMACWDYDRTRALMDERVQLDGIELTCLNLPVEETFFRMARHREFDISELSLSSYTLSLFRENPNLIAIPIFPSRYFRHSCIYINADSGIEKPQDIVGRRVGNPEYQMTAPVWIRGIMQDEFGVAPTSNTYLSGGEEEPGRHEKISLALPPPHKLDTIPLDTTLSRMIESGEIDALYTARAPSTFYSNPAKVKRLFPDYAAREHDYFRRTGIFPTMHIIAMRRDIYDKNRWIAQSLMKGFIESQKITYDDLHVTAALKMMLPWLTHHVEETEALMGKDFWPYGLAANIKPLTTFLRYHYEQGLSKRLLTPAEIFAPESLEAFKI